MLRVYYVLSKVSHVQVLTVFTKQVYIVVSFKKKETAFILKMMSLISVEGRTKLSFQSKIFFIKPSCLNTQ